MVVVVVDAQKLITTDALYAFNTFVSNVKQIIHTARANSKEVIYIRHDDGTDEPLTKGKEGYEIYEAFAPIEGERIFDKTVNSAFNGTDLLEHLKEQGEKEIMVVGLQTDYCIDATIKCGFEHGLKVIVPEYTNTTIDNKFMTAEQSYLYHNTFIWPRRYAICVTMEEALEMLKH